MKMGTNGRSLLCAVALLSAVSFVAGQSVKTRDAELKRLQGYWEGEGAGGKCSITITGDSLHYRAGSNWFKTTFTLPENTEPRQLHATIKDTTPTNSIGTVVTAIYKMEDGTLTISAVDLAEKPSAETFEKPDNRYIVRKVQPPKGNAEASKRK
jgi:uncharacterized protein (TIGR03067 family)